MPQEPALAVLPYLHCVGEHQGRVVQLGAPHLAVRADVVERSNPAKLARTALRQTPCLRGVTHNPPLLAAEEALAVSPDKYGLQQFPQNRFTLSSLVDLVSAGDHCLGVVPVQFFPPGLASNLR